MYLCDIHTHTLISNDSEAPLAVMAEAAMAAGLKELCVTDHCDLLDWDGTPINSFDWATAKGQYHAARDLVGDRLTLRLGLELGSAPYDPPAARRILAEGGQEIDFVLGSLHNWIGFRDNRDLYFTDYTNDPELCRLAMKNCLESSWILVTHYADCYDSLAHILYPLRYMRRDGNDTTILEYEEEVRAILTQVARTDHAMEVNTWRGATLEEWRPLLHWFKECGGRYVTIGSDAHAPEDMAKGVPEAMALLKESGFDYVTTYCKRNPILHEL